MVFVSLAAVLSVIAVCVTYFVTTKMTIEHTAVQRSDDEAKALHAAFEKHAVEFSAKFQDVETRLFSLERRRAGL